MILSITSKLAKSPNFWTLSHKSQSIIKTSISSDFRLYSTNYQNKGLVLGYYNDLSIIAEKEVDSDLSKRLYDFLKLSNAKGKFGENRLFIAPSNSYSHIALVSLGEKTTNVTKQNDNLRHASAIGVKVLKENGSEDITIDNTLSNHASSEGSLLGLYKYLSVKKESENKNSKEPQEKFSINQLVSDKTLSNLTWESGKIYAKAQNRARFWMDSPANLMTPTIFSEQVQEMASTINNLNVIVREKPWIREKEMGAFLSVTRGSSEEPRFIELHYNGGNPDDKPLAFVGKGVTFDSGGISIKPSSNMHHMKADMGGAATVAAAVLGIAELQLPINIKACIPLCENMPSSIATKPGDVVTAMNGKTVEVLNTDAEGRLILADALYYLTSTYQPHTVITVATLTGAMVVALGDVFAGTFSSSTRLWEKIEKAGLSTGDPFWRMPFHENYLKLIKQSNVADLANIGSSNGGGSCSAAAFLREFVPRVKEDSSEPLDMNNDESLQVQYAHIDIAGVMETPGGFGYLTKGMSGRPTRSFIELSKKFC